MRKAIPVSLLKAKREAFERFIPAKRERRLFPANTAFPKPEINVVGVGIGRKLVRGRPTSRTAVRIYVERKLPRESVRPDYFLPKRIGGVPTDVVETGRFHAFSSAIPVAQRRLRPAQPGCSVGFQDPANQFVMAATLGALVKRKGSVMILSNNHVLANEDRLSRGAPIFQPGLLDRGDPSRDQIARLDSFVRLSRAKPNQIDCAVAKLLENGLAVPTFLQPIGDLTSRDPIDAAQDMRVHKVGRTTGYTKGSVFDISADVKVEYDIGTLSFTGQILVQDEGGGAFSDAGDSGSVIVDRKSGQATGLLFGGSRGFTIANHLSDVLRRLQVRLAI